MNHKNFINSIDRFVSNYKKIVSSKARVGLIANQCSFSFYHKKYLFELIKIDKIFLLEHGFFSELQDQIPINNIEFYRYFSDIQWISLYGNNFESLKPSLSDLEDLDILIIDIQDIGSRYYTFLTSVYYVLQTMMIHRLTLKIILLDRPNPIILKKRRCEGSPLQEKYESFVGISGILHQHGLTPAELIYYYWLKINQNNKSSLYLIPFRTDVPIQKIYPKKEILQEISFSSQLQQDFFDIYPSPNMPTIKTAMVYTGQCLIEGTNLSEGRGTTKPFEIFGAPFIDYKLQKFISELTYWNRLGIVLRNLRFVPVHSKHKYMECNGWQIHILDTKKYHSLMVSLILLKELKKTCVDFDWYRGIYEFKSDYLAIEYLVGDEVLISFLNEDRYSYEEIYQYLKNHEKKWLQEIKKFYFYK
jgi:uncharacterized protein YbbC (DUF1343 family)